MDAIPTQRKLGPILLSPGVTPSRTLCVSLTDRIGRKRLLVPVMAILGCVFFVIVHPLASTVATWFGCSAPFAMMGALDWLFALPAVALVLRRRGELIASPTGELHAR